MLSGEEKRGKRRITCPSGRSSPSSMRTSPRYSLGGSRRWLPSLAEALVIWDVVAFRQDLSDRPVRVGLATGDTTPWQAQTPPGG